MSVCVLTELRRQVSKRDTREPVDQGDYISPSDATPNTTPEYQELEMSNRRL